MRANREKKIRTEVSAPEEARIANPIPNPPPMELSRMSGLEKDDLSEGPMDVQVPRMFGGPPVRPETDDRSASHLALEKSSGSILRLEQRDLPVQAAPRTRHGPGGNVRTDALQGSPGHGVGMDEGAADAGTQSDDGGDQGSDQKKPRPTTCPYCGSPLSAIRRLNGTMEYRCVQVEPVDGADPHGMMLYVKAPKPKKSRKP